MYTISVSISSILKTIYAQSAFASYFSIPSQHPLPVICADQHHALCHIISVELAPLLAELSPHVSNFSINLDSQIISIELTAAPPPGIDDILASSLANATMAIIFQQAHPAFAAGCRSKTQSNILLIKESLASQPASTPLSITPRNW